MQREGIAGRLGGACTLALAALCVAAGPASGVEIMSTDLSVPAAEDGSCIDRQLTAGPGVARRTVTAPAPGWVTARLDGAAGDWDLAVYDTATGDRVASSAFFGNDEVASGFVSGGERLAVQACRRSGPASEASLTVESDAVRNVEPQTLSLVRVAVPNAERKTELTELGLDLTEHGGRGFVEVVVHGEADAETLRDAKFTFVNEIADLGRQARLDRAADKRATARSGARASALPTGRTTYRHLADYNAEMKALVEQNPNLVKPITLPFKTLTGLSVQGIEITTDVNRRDGKPVFLQMGAHHAREWPSSEHAMEWAHELVKGMRSGDARVRRLVSSTRTIVVPVVNPEGFNVSREAASAMDDGRGGPDETPNLALPYEYQRKNCRVNNPAGEDPERGDCSGQAAPMNGIAQFGTDPNRNYGGFWGGPGATPDGSQPFGDFAQDYRGNGPFSERETQNIRRLVSTRQVTTLITNHTFSNLLLRPPGIQAQGPPVDEAVYKALGDAMASKNGYASEPSYTLYDTTGGTEDWTYYATGSLGFTFEIGPSNFHPPFAETIAEYEGKTAAAQDRGGNREAYFVAMESTANTARHSLLEGSAPPGAVLRLRKSFKTSTSPVIDGDGNEGEPILFDDSLDTVFDVPDSGRIDWHINPSTRPVAAQTRGRNAQGAPSPAITRNGRTAAQPPCPTYFEAGPTSCLPAGVGGFTDEQFTIPANGGGVDNGFATVKVAFPEGGDLDLEVYRAGANGAPMGEPVGTSAGGSNPEQTNLGPDPAPGNYVARIVNYAGGSTYDLSVTFEGPEPFVAGKTESWTLTCETGSGRVLATKQITVERGGKADASFGSACAAATNTAPSSRCVSRGRGVRARSVGRATLGRKRAVQRRRFGGARRLRARKGIDRYCVKGGGLMRVGYPTRQLNKRLSRRTQRQVRNEAVLAIATNKGFRIRGLRVGSRTRALRKRFRGERRVRVGRNTWYLVRSRKARFVFKTRRGRVGELGLANLKLTSSRKSGARLLRAYDGPRR